jgi:hypothetical protein
VQPLQHRGGGDDGWLHDVPELRRFEVRLTPGFFATTNSN